jgi:hypothetical protein
LRLSEAGSVFSPFLPCPFLSFFKLTISPHQEQSRAVGLLNPFERILLNLSSTILANRYMRNLFVLYALALHLFLFASLWGTVMAGGSDSSTPVLPGAPP